MDNLIQDQSAKPPFREYELSEWKRYGIEKGYWAFFEKETGIAQEREKLIKTIREQERERIKKLITDEIAIAHTEGTPTARLTSLFCKIKNF